MNTTAGVAQPDAQDRAQSGLARAGLLRRPARSLLVLAALVTLQATLPGCFGRFALTRKLYALNQSVNDKWLRSILTFVLVAVPVYGVVAFVDWALLNTIEFWGGTNPVDGESSDQSSDRPAAKTVTARDGSPVRVTLSPEGDVLRVELSRAGALPRVLVLTMKDGGAELRDGSGALVASLAQGESGAVVRGADGRVLEKKSASELAALESALRSSGRALQAELDFQGSRRLAANR